MDIYHRALRTVQLSFFLFSLFAFGCGGQSVYIREDQATKTIDYSDTDLKLMAEKMVESLLASDAVVNKPKIWISDVQNATSEYIDTQGYLTRSRLRY